MDDVIDDALQLLDCLNERQKFVLFQRFGLNGGKPKTLEQVGKEFPRKDGGVGITRECVRQYQNIALKKLREALTKKARQDG